MDGRSGDRGGSRLLEPFGPHQKRHAGDFRDALLLIAREVQQSGTPVSLDLPTVVLTCNIYEFAGIRRRHHHVGKAGEGAVSLMRTSLQIYR